MSDTSVNKFKTELVSMQRLLVQQRAVLSAEQHTKLMTTQTKTFAHKAGSLRGITADQVGELTNLIQSGPWTSDQQGILVMALAKAMDDEHVADAHDRRTSQDIIHFYNYPTEAEGKVLAGQTSIRVKIGVTLDILDRIQAALLKETSKRHVLAVVCSLQAKPEGWMIQDLRSWYLYFKKSYTARFKGRRADKTIGHIVEYPEHPSMLPDGCTRRGAQRYHCRSMQT